VGEYCSGGYVYDIHSIDTREIFNGFVTNDPWGRYSINHVCTPAKDGRIPIYCHSVELYGPFEVVDFWNTVRNEWKKAFKGDKKE
jgi:hypothetical protein